MESKSHKIINFIANGLIGLMILSFGEYAFLRIAPPSLWVQYYEVKPSKEVFEIGEELTFVSSSKIKRTVDMEYEDILRCDGKYYSVYKSSQYQRPAKESSGVWAYQGKVPFYKSTCSLESNISACPGFGICKPYKVQGESFNIE